MRRSWAANGIAVIVIGVTLTVGALGAMGSPKQEARTIATPQAVHAKPASPDPTRLAVPSCRTVRTHDRDLSFTCPSGWLLWENDTFTDDPVQRALIIVSNNAPLVSGGDDLPDGWFKADIGVDRRVAGLTFSRLMSSTCTESIEFERRVSCTRLVVGGRYWVLRVARDVGYEYRTIATVVNGIAYHAIAYIPLGKHAAEGRREVARLFSTLRVS